MELFFLSFDIFSIALNQTLLLSKKKQGSCRIELRVKYGKKQHYLKEIIISFNY
jgi:hypothetical protein